MKEKLENSAAQVELRQRQANSQIQHANQRLLKNEAATAALKMQLKINDKDKAKALLQITKKRRQLDVDRYTLSQSLIGNWS